MNYPKVLLCDHEDLEYFAISLVKEAQDIVDDGDEVIMNDKKKNGGR